MQGGIRYNSEEFAGDLIDETMKASNPIVSGWEASPHKHEMEGSGRMSTPFKDAS